MLSDHLAPGLRVVIAGVAPSGPPQTHRRYYAGRGNAFWQLLHESGLVPERLGPEDDERLPSYGIGLTDLAKTVRPDPEGGVRVHYDVAGLEVKIATFRPLGRWVTVGRHNKRNHRRVLVADGRVAVTGGSGTPLSPQTYRLITPFVTSKVPIRYVHWPATTESADTTLVAAGAVALSAPFIVNAQQPSDVGQPLPVPERYPSSKSLTLTPSWLTTVWMPSVLSSWTSAPTENEDFAGITDAAAFAVSEVVTKCSAESCSPEPPGPSTHPTDGDTVSGCLTATVDVSAAVADGVG